jgi:predicted NodU family carbamoyl transferase
VLVVDGFGNNSEVASLYELDAYGFPAKKETIYGYERSLGLLYQYAAEAVGMDGMNDVYKFLGYRTHIKPYDLTRCDALATKIKCIYLVGWMNPALFRTPPEVKHVSLIDYEKLEWVREDSIALFSSIIDDDQFMSRVRVGYVVQKVLEDVIVQYLSVRKFKTLLVAGGVFYNVRLNDRLRKTYPDIKFCAMPLAGDQGAGIGLAYAYGKLIDHEFKNLFWGIRPANEACDLETIVTDDAGVERIADLIASGVIVNVFHGPMEFGPRSLCNTSTLALCQRDLVDAINTANGRTTVMPMAPAMLQEVSPYLFSKADLDRTIASDKFMITAHNFLHTVNVNELGGAMHRDVDGSYSGRPQIIGEDTDFMYRLLKVLLKKHDVRAVINTSLNIHGQPIIYSQQDLQGVHNEWLKTCPAFFETFILEQPK